MEGPKAITAGATKRKADSIGRVAGSTTEFSGRGAQSGWTTCPLCGRHSKKLYALGRGIASHLQSVHTPWNPGKAEKKKRRRLAERRANSKRRERHEDNSDAAESEERKHWEPTQKEIDNWDACVLQIVKEIEDKASQKGDIPSGVGFVAPGLDRNGKACNAYRESLPEFLQAAADGDLKRLQSMITAAFKPNDSSGICNLIGIRDRNLASAEHWAAGGGHLPCLALLLRLRRESNGSVDRAQDAQTGPKKMRRRDGKTCLHYAARNGHLKCVHYLIEDQHHVVDDQSGDGTTPFHMACFGGHADVATYLSDKGADLFASNAWGCGATHWAGMTRNESAEEVRRLCDLLRSKGASFVARQNQGHTVLHKAAQKLNRHVIEYIAQSSEDGGAGLTAGEMVSVGLPDHGGHTASEIWRSVGGEGGFANRMRDDWGW